METLHSARVEVFPGRRFPFPLSASPVQLNIETSVQLNTENVYHVRGTPKFL